jgi:Transcriptional regulator
MTSPATDPRAARSREAILAAAFDLLAREGPGAITHQRVAQQAGVGRATVYRHWAAPRTCSATCCHSRAALLRHPRPAPAVLAAGRAAPARRRARPPGGRIARHRADGADPVRAAPGTRPHRHITVITERLAAAFALAVDAGELDTAPDAALAAAHLIGPLVYRTTLQAAAVPDSLLAELIDSAAHWRAPDPARSRPTSAPGQPTATTPGSSPPS